MSRLISQTSSKLDRKGIMSRLSESPLFQGLDPSLLNSLARIFVSEHWKAGHVTPASHLAKHFYVIAKGQVELTRSHPHTGREITVFFLNPGEAFDVVTLLDGKEHDLCPRVSLEATLLKAPINAVRQWIVEHPAFNHTLLPYLGEQMRKLEELASDLALHDTVTRLARLILAHATSHGATALPMEKEMGLINNLTHETLARMIGSVRVVVNRHMQVWKKQGILDLKRKEIIVKDLEALQRICDATPDFQI